MSFYHPAAEALGRECPVCKAPGNVDCNYMGRGEAKHTSFGYIHIRRIISDPIDARMQLASSRGQVYLEYAQKAFERGDLPNACSYAQEGLILTSGPFYLAVRDQLEEFFRRATAV